MPRPLTTAGRAAIATGKTISSIWFFDITTDEGMMYLCDSVYGLTYNGKTYLPMGDQIQLNGELKTGVDLVPEPFPVMFNGEEQLTSGSPIRNLLTRTWWQRQVYIYQVLFEPASNWQTPIAIHYQWYGFMDTIEDAVDEGKPSGIILNCESGIFRARGKNLRTYTDKDQTEINPIDRCFLNTPLKPFQNIPFGEANWKVAGADAPPAQYTYYGYNGRAPS